MIRKKRAQDKIDRYDREGGSLSGGEHSGFSSGGELSHHKSFLDKYIVENKTARSGEIERFPSIEARRKLGNEYTPTMIDSK